MRPYLPSVVVLVTFFILLFAYTKIVGPIPFSVNSVTTNKSEAFNVTGVGSVAIKPDIAVFSAGISASGPTVKAAQDQINTINNQIAAAVNSLGIETKDIQTANYNINPNYDSREGNQKITGYTASTNFSIKVRNIDKINQVIDAVTAAGANQVGGVSFDVDDKTKVENEARTKAIEEAKKKAEQAAKAGGFMLGRIINYSENFAGPVPMMARGAVALEKASPSTQIEPGSTEVKISVTLSYEIR